MKTSLAVCCLVLLAAAFAGAQTIPADEMRVSTQAYRPPPPPSLRVQTNLVIVPVIVRDSAGKLVGGLQQSDFQITDNGKPQVISSFSVETPVRAAAAGAPVPATSPAKTAPAAAAASRRYVALFFDDLNLPLGDLVPVRKAAQDFIRNDLEAGDRVAIFTSSTTLTLGFTEDMRKVQDTLAQLKLQLRRPTLGASCPRMSQYQAFQIANFNDQQSIELGIEQSIAEHCLMRDPMAAAMQAGVVKNQAFQMISLVDQYSRESLSVLKTVLQYVGKFPGRRMVVLASSGFLTMSTSLRRTQDSIVEIALRTGVVIHSLDAKGLFVDAASVISNGPRFVLTSRPDLQSLSDSLAREQAAQMNEPLSFLAGGTGGQFFHNSNDFARGFRDVTATPDVLYMLGYAPDNLKPDASYHTIKVTLAGAQNHKLDSRKGYFAPDRQRLPPVPQPDKFDLAVQGSDTAAEFPVGVTTRAEKSGNDSLLRVLLRFDPRELPFLRRDDRNVENLHFIAALFDAQGKLHTGVEGEIVLTLKDETLVRLSAQGLERAISLRAAPGAYRLRLVVQERMHGRLSAQSLPAEIR